jgi:hypothetical protein
MEGPTKKAIQNTYIDNDVDSGSIFFCSRHLQPAAQRVKYDFAASGLVIV